MKDHIVCICCLALLILGSVRGHAATPESHTSLVYFRNGKITVDAPQPDFYDLVGQISFLANLDIYIMDQELPCFKSLKIENLPLDQALRRIFRGCNYAVVYYPAPEGKSGVYISQHSATLQKKIARVSTARTVGNSNASNNKGASRNTTIDDIQVAKTSLKQRASHPKSSFAGTAGDTLDPAHRGAGDVNPRMSVEVKTPGQDATANSQGDTFDTSGSEMDTSHQNQETSSNHAGDDEPYEDQTPESDPFEDSSNETGNDWSRYGADPQSAQEYLNNQVYWLERAIENGTAEPQYNPDEFFGNDGTRVINTPEENLAFYQWELENLQYQ